MTRIQKRMATTTALALLATAALTSGATASYDPDPLPVPGIGQAQGVLGDGPRVEVAAPGGRLGAGRSVEVEVLCTTSTEAGCSGMLELAEAGGRRLATARLALPEAQSEASRLQLPAPAARRARQRGGLPLVARACVTDTLGRSDCSATNLRVRALRDQAH